MPFGISLPELLILLVVLAAGLALFTGVSWLTVIERLGGWIEDGCLYTVRKWQERIDRQAGEQATIEREEIVEEGRRKLEIREPVRIEPPALEIPKSPRIEREKQVPLFEDLPDTLLPPLNVLIQVNASGESSKSGVAPAQVPALAASISRLPRLKLRGLMAIPEPGAPRERYREVRALFDGLKDGFAWDTLSMGMSDDMELAVAEGSTMVRIGTAIFGPRS